MKCGIGYLVFALLAAACSRTSEETDHPRPAPSEIADVAPSRSATTPRKDIPTEPVGSAAFELTRRLDKQLTGNATLYQGENVVFVAMGTRLGKLNEAGLEWVHRIPKDTGFGTNEITGAGGRYPDLYYLTYVSPLARAPAPAFLPLPKGAPSVFSPGGGAGFVSGVARVEDTILVAGYSNLQGYVLVSAGGKHLVRKQKLPQDAGCKGDELMPGSMGAGRHALEPHALGATPRGTLISVGVLCNKRNPTLEVWAPRQADSKFMELPWRGDVTNVQAFPGRNDALWLVDPKGNRILRYDAGKISEVPAPPGIDRVTSRDGALYIHHRDAIYELPDASHPEPKRVAELRWPMRLESMVRLGSKFWVTREGRVYELTRGKGTRYSAGCDAPFVYLYSVTRDAPKAYSFPKTRKALIQFEHADKLRLVEFEAAGRHVGAAVPDEATARSLIAHLKQAMPKERPELLCFAPAAARTVDLGTGKSSTAEPGHSRAP